MSEQTGERVGNEKLAGSSEEALGGALCPLIEWRAPKVGLDICARKVDENTVFGTLSEAHVFVLFLMTSLP